MPIIGAKPNTGFRFGVGASIDLPLGDPRITRISTFNTAVVASTGGQVGVFATPTLYGAGNRWLLQGHNHFNLNALGNAVLGATATASQGPPIEYRSLKFIDTYYREIGRGVYAGAGLVYARQSQIVPGEGDGDWDSSPFVEYSTERGFDLSTQTAAGLGLSLVLDTRDNQNDASAGWYAASSYRAHFEDFLGGDSDWGRFYVDLRTYRALSKDGWHKIALWSYGDFVTSGDAPYLSLPATGTDVQGRSGRGYAEGQFRGEGLVYGEVEYRGLLTKNGFMGMVAFVNGTTVSSRDANQALFESGAVGAGLGLRLLLRRRSKTNFCVDVGWGRDGSNGIYVGLSDVF